MTEFYLLEKYIGLILLFGVTALVWVFVIAAAIAAYKHIKDEL